MLFNRSSYGIGQLLEDVNNGELAVPEFQRPEKWSDEYRADFLRSIARNWPPGSFLLLQGPRSREDFSPNPLSGAPESANPSKLILDGQQRATTLYHVLDQHLPFDTIFYFNLEAIRVAGHFLDEHLDYLGREEFVSTFGPEAQRAAAGIIMVREVFWQRLLGRWTSYLPTLDLRDSFYDVISRHLPGLNPLFEIPTIEIRPEATLSEVAKIFYITNRNTWRLEAFDLLVAKLYPHHFKLRTSWRNAFEGSEYLEPYANLRLEVPKVIALMEYHVARERGDQPRVQGIREENVLEITPEQFIERWESGLRAYESALRLLTTSCGVIRPSMMPQQTMVLPIAYSIARIGELSEDQTKCIRRWFWARSYLQTYRKGANTQAVSDAGELLRWLHHPQTPPAWIQSLAIAHEPFLTLAKEGNILKKACGCAVVAMNARDWHDNSGTPLKQVADKLDYHHLFSKRWVTQNGNGMSADIIANISVVRSKTNRSIGARPPSELINEERVFSTAIESHYVPIAEYQRDRYRQFLPRRARMLKELFQELTRA